MLENYLGPNQSKQIIKDTLASFLADFDQIAEGEPRLVILQKPGVQLIMLGGPARERLAPIETSADTPLRPDQVMELARRAPELRAKAEAAQAVKTPPPRPTPPPIHPVAQVLADQIRALDAKPPSAAAKATAQLAADRATIADPELAQAARAMRVAGSKYRCGMCRKESHKPLTLVKISHPNLDEAFACSTCRKGPEARPPTLPQEPQIVSRPPSPPPAPQKAVARQPGHDIGQIARELSGEDLQQPSDQGEETVFTDDMF